MRWRSNDYETVIAHRAVNRRGAFDDIRSRRILIYCGARPARRSGRDRRAANSARGHGAISLLQRHRYVWVRANGICCGDPGITRYPASALSTGGHRRDLYGLLRLGVLAEALSASPWFA